MMTIKDRLRKWMMGESLAEWDARLDAQANGGLSSGAPWVSDTAAVNLATVFNAATIRTQYIAMLPLVTYYRDREGSKKKFKGSPVYGILHDRPNALMSSLA